LLSGNGLKGGCHLNGFRYEQKYLISEAGYRLLQPRLKTMLDGDENVDERGEYFIRSLYFDDAFQRGLVDKREGALLREKFRVRFYNMDDSFIRLESKQKHDTMTKKESARLTRAQVEQILAGDWWELFSTDDQLLENFYLKARTRVLRPTVLVDYMREAYVFEDVRITFDKNIRTANYDTDLFDPDLVTVPVLPSDRMIMEVKFDDALPAAVKRLLQPVEAARTAFSKYEMCRQFQ